MTDNVVFKTRIVIWPIFSPFKFGENYFSIKHDLTRSCFQLWPKIGDEGDKISRKKTGEALAETDFSLKILSPSEPILRAKIENMISSDYVLCYIPRALETLEKNENFVIG